jgi:hypothetical protein
MPKTFLYRCPNTGQNVQGWSADEVTDHDDTYQSFPRIACTRVHLTAYSANGLPQFFWKAAAAVVSDPSNRLRTSLSTSRSSPLIWAITSILVVSEKNVRMAIPPVTIVPTTTPTPVTERGSSKIRISPLEWVTTLSRDHAVICRSDVGTAAGGKICRTARPSHTTSRARP